MGGEGSDSNAGAVGLEVEFREDWSSVEVVQRYPAPDGVSMSHRVAVQGNQVSVG